MKLKRVVRKYYSKSLGKIVTKVYKYDTARYGKRRKKSLLLVGKSGKVYNKRLESLLSKYEDFSDKEMIKTYVDYYSTQKQRITIKSIETKMLTNRYEKMFVNAGYTIEEAAEEIGVAAEDLLNEEYWEKDVFTTPNGKEYKFEFRYDDSVFVGGGKK